MEGKIRNSNIEILRIISIIFIVISHYTIHNGIENYDISLGINRFILEVCTLGNIGSIIFVMITGYFLINTKSIKLKKILRLIFQVFFYSFIIYLIMILIGNKPFNIKDLIRNTFPITFKMYWFATAYFIIYLFSPFINKFLNSLTRKQHLTFLIVSLVIFSVLRMATLMDFYSSELIEFLLFYSLGAYISKYPNNLLTSRKNAKILLVTCMLLIMLSIITFDLIGSWFSKNSIYFLSRQSILTILFSLALFSIFINMNPKNNRVINYISSCIFGVYLISDNIYIRPLLWEDIFKNSNWIYSNFLVLHMIITVLIVIVVCLLIEIIRKNIFEKPIFNLIEKKIDNIESRFINIYNNMIDKLIKK